MRNVLWALTVVAFNLMIVTPIWDSPLSQGGEPDYGAFLGCYEQLYAMDPDYAHQLGDIGSGAGQGHLIATPVAPTSSEGLPPGLYIQTNRGGMRFAYPGPQAMEKCPDGLAYRLDQHWTSGPGAKVWQQNFFRVKYGAASGAAQVERIEPAAMAQVAPQCFRAVSDNDGANWDAKDQELMRKKLSLLLEHAVSRSLSSPELFCKRAHCSRVLKSQASQVAQVCRHPSYASQSGNRVGKTAGIAN